MGGAEHSKLNPQPGDHISWNRGIYTHHAIVVEVLGGGRLMVVEYIKGDGVVKHDVAYVQDGVPAVIEQRSPNPGDVIKLAIDRIGEDKYNLVCNNCEHFANWCITGRSESPQAEQWVSNGMCQSLGLTYKHDK